MQYFVEHEFRNVACEKLGQISVWASLPLPESVSWHEDNDDTLGADKFVAQSKG